MSQGCPTSAEMAKVLFLLHYSGFNNGATHSLIDVILGLRDIGMVCPVVVYPDSKKDGIDYLEEHGIECHHIKFGRWDYHFREKGSVKIWELIKVLVGFIFTPLSIIRIKALLARESIGVVYSNTATIYIGYLLHALFGVSHVCHIREFGAEDHGLAFFPSERAFIHLLCLHSDLQIFISHALENRYSVLAEQYGVGLNPVVIYNDLSSSLICKKDVFNSSGTLRLLVAGSIQPGKDQLTAIKAVEFLRNSGVEVNLHIAGHIQGEYCTSLMEYVDKRSLTDLVFFDGFIKDMRAYRKSFDVCIVPSASEAFGRVTVEGMLSELVVIGADTAGTLELIDDMNTGLLFHQGDYRDLSEKILMVNNDRDMMKRLAENGFGHALETFTKANAAAQIGEKLNQITDASTRGL